ncbi:MAG: hypothetical protein RI988_642 [Pseudomonadota bacterium]
MGKPAASAAELASSQAGNTLTQPLPNPARPGPAPSVGSRPPGAVAQPPKPGESGVITLEQVTLAAFAQVVFAEIAGKNVSIDPPVAARRELVTFRSGAGQTVEQLQQAARLLLSSYGVAIIDVGGLVRVMPETAGMGGQPEIRRGAASPETPPSLRPVFHLVDLQAVRQADVTGFLRTLFANRVTVQDDPSRNAVLISGTPDNVNAALEAIRVLDQPILAGGRSLAITPVFSSAEEFARRLYDVLTAQGYSVQPPVAGPLPQGGIRSPIMIVPVTAINSVYVFARGDEVVRHIETLATTLDRPNERGIGRNFFTYQVRHKDASTLADTLAALLRSGGAAAPAAGAAAQPGTAAANAGVVVDKASNTLIFQARQEEYGQLTALLQRLDQPAKGALIEVTVAELSLDDAMQLGLEWSMAGGATNGGSYRGGTLGGLSLGSSGFNLTLRNSVGEVRAVLNALASDNRANILSSPRVMARNGETATIQVGQEVPIITSQATGLTSGANTGQVLQTIQYRSTGVILRVKPVIHSSDQIDLDVVQEVSGAQLTETGVNSSPTFSSRKLETKLTMQNGTTVLLGGLISEERTFGAAGIPLLKDIPGLGALFSKQSNKGGRRELIVLITPYVVATNREAEELTRAFRSILQPWAQPAAPSPTRSQAAPAQAPVPAPAPTQAAPAGSAAPAAAPASAPKR